MTSPSDRVRPAPPGQCQFPSERMLNGGGCTYGTAQERAQWRVEHFQRRRLQGWPTGKRDPDFCARSAKWVIDGGLHLCALHAGAEALEIVMTGRGAPEAGEDDVTKPSVSTSLGLAAMLADGGPLANLRGHAQRIADDIAATALEVGGQPWASPRYRDASAVAGKVHELEKIADGTYNHPDIGPQATSATLEVLREVERERERQQRKGWTPQHDDGHRDGEIADQAAAAICSREDVTRKVGTRWVRLTTDAEGPDRRRELIQGIALAVAEVERLDRLALDGVLG